MSRINLAVLGNDSTVGGPGGSPLSPAAYAASADYILNVVGAGVGAVNTKTGNTDYSVSSGDHAPVFQSAASNLLAVAGPTAGTGGLLVFKGQAQFQSQLALNPNVSLVGQSNGYYASAGGQYGSLIVSTFNGSCILLTGDARSPASTFPYLAHFTLRGNAGSSQNGIEWNTSGGIVADTLVYDVRVFNMGLAAFLISGSTTKVLMHGAYAEFSGTGIKQTGGILIASNVYMTGNTNGYDGSAGSGGGLVEISNLYLNTHSGVGVQPLASGSTTLSSSRLDSCAGGALTNAASVICIEIIGNVFSGNGGTSIPSMALITPGTSQAANIVGNAFYDSRGASAANNHIALAATNSFNGNISNNSFYGNQQAAVAATARSASKAYAVNNKGFNDTAAKLATPFHTSTAKIGIEGNTATVTASTTYTVGYTPLYLAISGGAGVSITIADPAGNTAQSGLTSFTGMLPVGWTINFGAFSVAPTVYAGVI